MMGVTRSMMALAAAFLALLAPTAGQAEWRRAETQHFVIYSDRSDAIMRDYAAMLEDFDALLRRVAPPPKQTVKLRKLDVYLVGTEQQLRRIWPQAPDHIAGFYLASDADIFAVAIRNAAGIYDTTSGDDVVLHEYVHHYMAQHHTAAWPAWLVEGYAEYYATADFTERRITFGGVDEGNARALANPAWVDMDKVLSRRVSDLSTSDRGAFYAQSWLLTHYVLSDQDRRAKLDVYLKDWRETGDSVGAWKKAYGQDPEALRRTLLAYAKRRMMVKDLPRNGPSQIDVAITRLSDAAEDILLETLQIKSMTTRAGRPHLLQSARKTLQRYPDDRWARIAAARAQTKFGDRAIGEALLERMIAADANDYEAMMVLAESRILSARTDTARREEHLTAAARLLGAATKIQPDDYRLYSLFAQTRQGRERVPSDNTLNVLIRAVQLGPQVKAVRMAAASALMSGGDAEEVRHMLEPLLNDPHGGALTRRAQQMIAALDKGETAPPADVDDEEEGG